MVVDELSLGINGDKTLVFCDFLFPLFLYHLGIRDQRIALFFSIPGIAIIAGMVLWRDSRHAAEFSSVFLAFTFRFCISWSLDWIFHLETMKSVWHYVLSSYYAR